VFVVALVWGLIVIFQLRGRFAREAQQGAAMQQAAAQPPQPTAEPWHQG